MPANFLAELLFIITAAFVGGFVARTLKLPSVLGYITSGIVFGTLGRNFFQSYSSLMDLSQIGVSLLLFTLGFEISLDTIKKLKNKILLVGLLQVVATSLALLPLFLYFNFPFSESVLFAVLFSFSSTAVVVKFLEEKGLIDNFPGDNVLLLLLVQDLFIVPVIFLLPVLFSQNQMLPQAQEFVLLAIKPILIFIALLLLSKFFLKWFMNFLFRYPSHELTILATIFTAAGSISLFMLVGLPQSIAAFLAGVILSEQGKNLTPISEIRPFREVFLVLFFVMTGFLIDFQFLLANAWVLIIIALCVIVVKFCVLYIILRFSFYSPSSSIFISSHLSNIGEFALVISQIAFLAGYVKPESYYTLLSVFSLSLFFLPIWVRYSRIGGEKLASLGLLKQFTGKSAHFFKGFEDIALEDHVVVCGHGRVGKEVRRLLELAKIPYVIVDVNRSAVSELSKTTKFVIYGDPTDKEVLANAFLDKAKVLVVAVPDSFSQKRIIKHALTFNKKLVVLCRSHLEKDELELLNLGASKVILPEIEAGIKIGSEVLKIFNVSQGKEDAYVSKVKSYRENE